MISFIAFPESVPVLRADGVSYETDFSAADGWVISIEATNVVALRRNANPAQNIAEVPLFRLNGFRFAYRMEPNDASMESAGKQDVPAQGRKGRDRKAAAADPKRAEAPKADGS